MQQMPPVLTDLALSRRLERAEGASSARFVEARALVDPPRGATWLDVDGVWAMFDGAGSPLTQTFGLGLEREVTPATLDAIERFFQSRGASVDHEMSPLALGEPLALLHGRGYAPIELTAVMWRALDTADAEAGDAVESSATRTTPTVDAVEADEAPAWARTAAEGWSEDPDLVPFVLELSEVYARTAGATCFAARIEGQMAATGVLAIHDGVALLAGASTRPAFRRRGAQNALLAARLRHARAAGCDIAMICARPGSDSQRNAERRGFRVAYTRIKWRLGA